MSEGFEELSTRDGELSELTLFRYLNGELDETSRNFVEARLADSARDRARLDELRAFADEVSVAPPPASTSDSVSTVVQGPWSRTAKVVAAITAVAAVVALAFFGTRMIERSGQGSEGQIARAEAQDEGDTIRTKGSTFDLRVQVERDATQWLANGDVVAPGETVQFVAYPRAEGYLLVVGIDATQSVYPCHPNRGGDAVGIEAVAGELLLEGGLTFDDVLGPEHIIGLFCPEPFSFEDVEEAGVETLAQDWVPRSDCLRADVRLIKESP